MTTRRIVLGALALALLASLALVSAAWRWPGSGGRSASAPPPGTLRFGELMVLDAVETPEQLAALREDCRRTGQLLPGALAASPVSTEVVAARTALDRYLALCRWYTLDVAVAGANAATERLYTASYRFTGSMRASDGRVYTCESTGQRTAGAGPPQCWTADLAVWPRLARLVALESRLVSTRADVLAATACPLPDLDDVCAATIARDRASARSGAVFATALARRDTRVLTWLGTPASVGVAEEDAAIAAGRAYTAVCRSHGFAGGTPGRHERDLFRSAAAMIKIALAGGGDR